ncbi:MAG: hypothetical protein ACOCX4_07165, partial [Planctomycetota bacterium]
RADAMQQFVERAGELLDGTGALAARLERWLALTFWAPCAATLFPVAICGLRRRFRAAVLALAAPVAGLIATAVLGVLLLLVLGGWRLFFGAAPS